MKNKTHTHTHTNRTMELTCHASSRTCNRCSILTPANVPCVSASGKQLHHAKWVRRTITLSLAGHAFGSHLGPLLDTSHASALVTGHIPTIPTISTPIPNRLEGVIIPGRVSKKVARELPTYQDLSRANYPRGSQNRSDQSDQGRKGCPRSLVNTGERFSTFAAHAKDTTKGRTFENIHTRHTHAKHTNANVHAAVKLYKRANASKVDPKVHF